MLSESERIRKAVQRVLGPPPAEGPAPLEGLDEDAQAIHRDGELPPRIMAKVPAYLAFLNEFLHVGRGNRQALVDLVLEHKSLVYDDLDFVLYVSFVIKRNRSLGQNQQADAMDQVLSMIRMIGLIHG